VRHAVAFCVEDQQMPVMNEPIDHRCGHLLVAESFMIPLSSNAWLVEHSYGVE
jgi:hypothetical protein